jgi:hypothetical protein
MDKIVYVSSFSRGILALLQKFGIVNYKPIRTVFFLDSSDSSQILNPLILIFYYQLTIKLSTR